jgi:hypothetical protein
MAVNSYRYAWVASTSELPSTGTTVDLGIGQIGVFDGKTYQATNAVTAKSILIAQGTPDDVFPQGVAQGNETFKSGVIKKLNTFSKVTASRGQGMVVTLGFDGVDTTKNLTVKKGDPFNFWVTLTGQPINNLLGGVDRTHPAIWTQQFTAQLPCVDDCADTCDEAWDANIVADAAIQEVLNRNIIGGEKLSKYIKVSKLVSCDTPSGLPTVSFSKWTLTIPDTGDQTAIAKVQAQYPGVVIKRTKRDGVFSTYEITLADGVTPADFSSVGNPVVPTCGTCPSGCPDGYTLQEALDAWIVSRPLSGTENLTTSGARTTFANTLEAAYSADSSEFLSFNGATASVKLYFTTGSTPTALLSDQIVQVGTDVAICTQTTPVEIEWVECTTCTKAQKVFTLTVKNDDCGGTFLTQLQEIYGNGVSVLASNIDTCTTQYALTVTSDNIDCDACDDVKWEFSAPPTFNGLTWIEVAGEHYGTDCNIGLKFESIYEQSKATECILTQRAYEFEPLFIQVSTFNNDANDFKSLCEETVPVTVVQNVKYPIGFGRQITDRVIESNFYFNKRWAKDPAERDAFNYQLGIDLNGYYDQYILEYEIVPAEASSISGLGNSRTQAFELSVFYKEGTGGTFENTISAFAVNSGISLEAIQ